MAKIVKKKAKKRKPVKQVHFGNHPNQIMSQWKPGQSGNPAGPPKCKTQLKRYICIFLDMTKTKFDNLDTKAMTVAEQTAYETVKHMSTGEWLRTKAMLDRDDVLEDREQGIPDQTIKVTIKYV